MTTPSTWRLRAKIPRELELEGSTLDRESFLDRLWLRFGERGLVGIHEGTLLSEQASEQGLETDSWTVDAAEAPRERDWVAGQSESETELYFSSRQDAERALADLRRVTRLSWGPVEEQKPEDWIAQWRESFKGAEVPPYWAIVPSWDENEPEGRVALKINPGAGFGTGTHETTQLCLRAIGERAPERSLKGSQILDFGSGSGILAIGAALLGGLVDAVEIDPLAIENAEENADLNGVGNRIRFSRELTSGESYDIVIANILRPVLLQFADELVGRMKPGAALILSGLIESDVASVTERYSALLSGRAPRVHALGEWRGLVW